MAYKKGRKSVGVGAVILACASGLFDRLTEHQIVFVCLLGTICAVYALGEFTERGGASKAERICRWIALGMFCSLIWLGIGIYFNSQRVDAEFQDVREHISTRYSTPSDRVVGNMRFTVTNNSSLPINIKTIWCNIRVMQLMDDIKPNWEDVSIASEPMRLQPFGDSYSIHCPSNSDKGIKLPTDWVTCGDVVFTVIYAIDEAPKEVVSPRYRYIMYANEHEWIPTALNDPIVGCNGSPQ